MTISAQKIRLGAASQMLFGSQDLGASKGGLIFKYDPKFMEIKCDQFLAPVAVFKTEEAADVEVALYQTQMALISVGYAVYGLGNVTTVAGTPNTDTLKFGGQVYVPISTFDATIPKNDNTTNNLLLHLNKIFSAKGAPLNFARDKDTEYKVTLQALADTTQAAGQQLGYLVEQY
ncbi:MAG: hypothetical protein H0X24_05195 [Ktedonobacterales bacterium]|nr:hypothetical protein [Ktedonobacterales bacterium]